MPSRTVALVLGLGLSACRSSELRIPDAPDDVAYVALLVTHADGTMAASTPAFAVEETPPLLPLDDDPNDDTLLRLVGFGADPQTGDARLRIASDTDPLIAEPLRRIWRRAMDQERWEEEDGELLLTSDTLPPCPTLLREGVEAMVDITCNQGPCAARAQQRGCQLDLDVSTCDPTIPTQVDLNGRGLVGCTEQRDRPAESAARIECDSCPIDLYPLPAPERLNVSTRALVGDRPYQDADLNPGIGYVSGLTALEDRLVVSSFGGAHQSYLNCDAAVPTTLHLLDLATLDDIAQPTAPPCIVDLLPDPAGSGFLGLEGRTEPRLHRFDADGALVESLPLPVDPTLVPVVMTAVGHRVVVLSAPGSKPQLGFTLITVDTTAWTIISTAEHLTEAFRVRCLAAYDEESIMLCVRTIPKGAYLYPVEGQSTLDQVTPVLGAHGGSGNLLSFLSRRPNGGPMLGSVENNNSADSDRVGGIHVLDPNAPGINGRLTPFAGSLEQIMDAWASTTWPADPSLSIVALSDQDEGDAFMALFDESYVRLLPGEVPVPGALGQASRVTVMEEAVFFLYPNVGYVARVVPAR